LASILIIGASHGIGLEATRQALAAGHHVRALARSADTLPIEHPQLVKLKGNALDRQDVEGALAGVAAVIEALGIRPGEMFRPVTLFSGATRVLIAAMQACAVRRLVAVTGFGAGESGAAIHFLQRLPFKLVFGYAYADKGEQERLIKASGLEWTIARPGVLTNGAKTGRYRVLTEPAQWRNGMIARADVAAFLVRQVGDRDCIGKAPVLIG
jgi:putative NADH-flavin reductase